MPASSTARHALSESVILASAVARAWCACARQREAVHTIEATGELAVAAVLDDLETRGREPLVALIERCMCGCNDEGQRETKKRHGWVDRLIEHEQSKLGRRRYCNDGSGW